MTAVITVPPSLDDQTFEQVLEQLAAASRRRQDARRRAPHAMGDPVRTHRAAHARADARRSARASSPPEADETATYWARAGFFQHAEALFDLTGHVPRARGGESDVLLEITPIAKSEDVHRSSGASSRRRRRSSTKELKLDSKATMGFAMTLSEVCQNIIEHAGHGGWVAVQTYKWTEAARPARRRHRGVRRGRRLSPVARERARPAPTNAGTTAARSRRR